MRATCLEQSVRKREMRQERGVEVTETLKKRCWVEDQGKNPKSARACSAALMGWGPKFSQI